MSRASSAASLIAEATEVPRVHYAFHSHGDVEAQWSVVHVQLDGQVSAPYKLELELTAAAGEDPAKLSGKACSLVLRREDHARCVHGVVSRIVQHGAAGGQTMLRVTVVPALELLRHRVDCRIFQDKSVPEVLDLVLTEALSPYGRKHASKLRRAEYPRREYVVQHRESDLAFVERLMAEEGIWYRFEQSDGMGADDAELLTLLDTNEQAPEAALGPTGKELPVALSHERDHHTRVVRRLFVERREEATRVEVAEANWSHPEVREEKSVGEGDVRPHYEPHGVTLWAYEDTSYTRSDVEDQARMRWELLHGRTERLRGHGNLDELAVGMRVLVNTDARELHGEWVITSLHETGRDTQQGASAGSDDYANSFTAQRFERPLRPVRRAKPRVSGVALGHVVGADGKPTCEAGADDIHTDVHGRVRVKLTWDRTEPGSVDATTTCWLRVVQAWSGAGFGAQFLPRVGMEVVIGFVDGDPDRPLVTGCVYNGLARAPHALPQHKTRSYLRTQSSPGGEGYNELLFDDAKDHELVALRAQRDHLEQVLRDQTLEIGGARAERVHGDETVMVKGARSHTVHGAERLKVADGSARLLDLSGDDTTLVAKNRELVVAGRTGETYGGGRRTVVQAEDVLEVADGAHKRDHVSGQYNILADEHFRVQQGDDQLYMKDTFYVASQGSVQLKNAGFHLHADAQGNTTLDVGKQLTIRVGSAQIQLKSDGTVVVTAAREAKLSSGPSEVALKPAGAELKAAKLDLTATATMTLKAKLIALN